jgi:hypothetical protein
MAEVVSIEVRKNWSGTFQSLEIAVAFFKIAWIKVAFIQLTQKMILPPIKNKCQQFYTNLV